MTSKIKVNLALQGGGAHGAFTWGVLDRLLDEPEIEVSAISGTSAGALNGAAFKSGWLKGGPEGARDMLDWLWGQIGALEHSAVPRWMSAWMPAPAMISQAVEMSIPYAMGDVVGRMISPYAWGPFYPNPLEKIVDQFDFDRVCSHEGPELFVCATHVRDGKIRVFDNDRICTNAILASACLPTLFQAVTCTDPRSGQPDAFWDGGYTGNPALFPLFEGRLPDDILIVNINPLERSEAPLSAPEIQNRINEISFNAALLRDLRAIAFVKRLIAEGSITPGLMKDVLVHFISDDALMRTLSVRTKVAPTPHLLETLFEAGRKAAGRFLKYHAGDLNERATVDLQKMFG